MKLVYMIFLKYIYSVKVYFAEDYEDESKLDTILEVRLSDNSIFKMKKMDVVKITEAFFDPSLINIDDPGINILLKQTIEGCSIYGKQLLRGVVTSGRLTQLQGFVNRLNKELTKMEYSTKLKYHHTVKAAEKQ